MREAEIKTSPPGNPARPQTPSSAPLSRRERNKQDKLQRIRKAASALFKERGFEGTTTQAIAEKADIGSGTLFLYARTKEDLLAMVMASEIRDTVRKAHATMPPRASLPEQAWHIFSRLLRYHARDPDLSRYYVRENSIPRHVNPLPPNPNCLPAASIVDTIAGLVVREQQLQHVKSDVAASVISWGLFAMYYGALANFLVGRYTLQHSLAEMRQGFTLLFDGVRSRDGGRD